MRVKEVGGETLVLDDQGGFVHQLNHTASYIWRQCDGKTSIAEMASLLADEFGVEDAVAASDVGAVLGKLCELKLVIEITT